MDWLGRHSSWELLFDITSSSSSASLNLEGGGALSFGRWELQIEMGGCELEFEDLVFRLSDMEVSCVTDVEVEVAFDAGGFDGAEISFGSFEIPMLDFVSVSGGISYELDSKEVSTRFSASPDASESCIGVNLKLVTEGTRIRGLEITGVNLRGDVGRITFTYAHTAVWDAITLSGGTSGECGVSWTSQVYMKDRSPYLFSVDSVSFNLTYAPCASYSFIMKAKYEMAGDIDIELSLRGSF
jgi:hypothetical protein